MKMQNDDGSYSSTFVIVGGGIAGVTCAETISNLCPDEPIILITESTLVKTVTSLESVTNCLYRLHIEEREVNNFGKLMSSIVIVIVGRLWSIDSILKRVYTMEGQNISYRYLCICTGGRAKLIKPDIDRVIGIRDTDSVLQLQERVKSSRKIVVVGNGGIASELVYAIKDVEIHWVVKDNHIASTFVDAGAAEFMKKSLLPHKKQVVAKALYRTGYNEMYPNRDHGAKKPSFALGPDWHKYFDICGLNNEENSIKIYHNAEIKALELKTDLKDECPLIVSLTTGERIECDFLISATGVCPRIDFHCSEKLLLSESGFILVNSSMETSIKGIYAAGDVCSASWNLADNFFQMRLWTQARQMGAMAGRSMVAALKKQHIHQDFCFELFGHTTTLFGFDVVLLGHFNGQKLGSNYEILLRSTPGKEYIKLILCEGKLRGAILIGNKDLAETCENLLLSGLDLSCFREDLLNPDIDIDDFFD